MKPTLFYAWGLPVHAYTFFLCLSFVVCVLGMIWRDRRAAIPIGARPDTRAGLFDTYVKCINFADFLPR